MDQAFLDRFRLTVDLAAERLRRCSDDEAGRAPGPGRWSKKEIIGHLIDSAANNHSRFVRAQSTDDLVYDGYDQDEWVRAQRYGQRRWTDLIQLWQAYNLHLADVMAGTDPASLVRPRARHTLDAIAFRVPPAGQPATLDYLMRDYVEHLEHHLRQALPGWTALP